MFVKVAKLVADMVGKECLDIGWSVITIPRTNSCIGEFETALLLGIGTVLVTSLNVTDDELTTRSMIGAMRERLHCQNRPSNVILVGNPPIVRRVFRKVSNERFHQIQLASKVHDRPFRNENLLSDLAPAVPVQSQLNGAIRSLKVRSKEFCYQARVLRFEFLADGFLTVAIAIEICASVGDAKLSFSQDLSLVDRHRSGSQVCTRGVRRGNVEGREESAGPAQRRNMECRSCGRVALNSFQ